jgi:hypothetical protein
MFPPNDLDTTSLMASLGIVLIATFLGLRQWYERRGRDRDLSGEDRAHFFRQDLRRAIGVGMLLLLALGIWVGANMPPLVGGGVNIRFLQVWLLEISLVVALLFLAAADLFATRAYARRHRQSMAHERREILRDTLHRAHAQRRDRGPHGDENAE